MERRRREWDSPGAALFRCNISLPNAAGVGRTPNAPPLRPAILTTIALSALTGALLGCTGQIHTLAGGGGSGPMSPTPEACESISPTPGATPLRRLSHTEYRNVVRDAFPEIALPNVALAADDTQDGFENSAALNTASPLLVAN